MTFHPKHLIRYGLAVVTAVAAVGCKSDGTGTDDGEIAVSLNPTSASVVQGGNTTVTATLTRSGGFTGAVVLAVTGNPAGVTAAVSNEVTSGAVTTATITVTVGAGVAPGVYPLVVTGTGSGVTAATASFSLTVTAAPAAYTLSLSAAALTIPAGASAPTTTVNLARTNFTGNVTLSVEGLPAGVTPAFAPNPATANSSVLTLTVGAGVPAAVYNLTVRGVAPGLADRTTPLTLTVSAAPAPSYTLSLSSAALSIPQGASTPTTTVNVNRINFTGDVTLSVAGLPTGVTPAFVPNPATGNSSVLTLTVGAAVPAAVYNLTVNGTGTPGNQSTPLVLTVTAAVAGNFTLTTTPATSASLPQGTSTNVTVNINRTGGNTSNIALTATGTLPTGMTLAFVPTSTTTNTSTLTITTTAATPVGAYPIVIRGNTTGLAEQTVNLTVNVTAASGGSGNVTVSFAACTAANKAAWFAFQDGTSGAWTRVTGVNDVYQFNITQSKGGFAYVLLGTGTSTINVLYFTQAELIAGQFGLCTSVASGKSVTATVANLPAGQQGLVSFGAGFASALANGPVTINNVLDGSHDVVAYAGAFLGPAATDRVFLARGLNPANGGSLGTVDFTGAGSSIVGSASITLAGGVGGETYSQGMTYQTGATCDPAPLYQIGSFAGSPFTAFGVAAANQAATDFHRLTVTAISGTTSFRLVSESFKLLAARTLTLPSPLGTVTVTDAGGPYKRMNVVTTLPADLNSSVVATYTDNTAVGKAGTIIASAGWLGGLAVSLTLPDFSALAGWSNAWAAATGDNLTWTFAGSTASLTSLCQEGGRVGSSIKTGTF